MKLLPDGFVELTSDERGPILSIAFQFAVVWAFKVTCFFLVFNWLVHPDDIQAALWWFPVIFVGAFWLKRKRLMQEAQAIVDRINKKTEEELALPKNPV